VLFGSYQDQGNGIYTPSLLDLSGNRPTELTVSDILSQLARDNQLAAEHAILGNVKYDCSFDTAVLLFRDAAEADTEWTKNVANSVRLFLS
jgi:hypothetical protein